MGDVSVISKSIISKLIIQNKRLGSHCEIALKWMPDNLIYEKPNSGLGNGLVPSGSKSLTELMLIQLNICPNLV